MVVSTETSLRAGQGGIGVPVVSTDFLLSKTFRPALGTPDLLVNGCRVIWSRSEFDNLPPSHSVVRNVYSYAPTVSECVRDVDSNCFTFNFYFVLFTTWPKFQQFWL